jgi:hypothetical protein
MDARDILDAMIFVVIIIGSIFAGRRFYQDMTRPLDNRDNTKKKRPTTVINTNKGKK